MAGGVALWGGLLVTICVLLFILGATSSGPSENVVFSAVNQNFEALKRSIIRLQRDNAVLAGQANKSAALSAENVALRKSLRALEEELAALKPMNERRRRSSSTSTAVRTVAKPGATAFTRERAQQVATNGKILLTFVNKIRLDFAMTWVYHVRRLGMTNWLVGATDKASLVALLDAKIPTFDMLTNLPEGEWPWGSASFKSLGPHKLELIYKCLIWDLDMIITDVDALVLREPFEFMARCSIGHAWWTSNKLSHSAKSLTPVRIHTPTDKGTSGGVVSLATRVLLNG